MSLPQLGMRSQAEGRAEGLRAAVPVVYVLGALVVGGAEKQLLLLLQHLDRTRFAPHVIAFEPGPWEPRFRVRAVSVDVIGFAHGRTRALFRCWRRLRQLRPNIVHTIGRTANYIGRLAAIAAGVPVIVMSERSAAFTRSPLMIRLDRLLAPFTTHVISNSRHAATFFLERAIVRPTRLSVIANGIEASRYGPTPKERVGLEIGNIGDLRPEKNQIDLVPTASLRIAGDGPLRSNLEAFAADLGISGQVALCGWVEDVAKFLGGANVYVHCSTYEGFPNALMEAMACGLPCVAYDTTGCRELIEHMETGMLVELGNYQALADAVLRLAREPDLARALGSAARSAIVEGFTVERMVAKTCAVYESTLRSASGDR